MENYAAAPPQAQAEVLPPTYAIPEDIADLLGDRPLVFPERAEVYDRLFSRLAQDVHPDGFVEWLYLKEIMDLTWETLRLRRIKAALITIGIPAAGAPIVAPAHAKSSGLSDIVLRTHGPLSQIFVTGAEEVVRQALAGDETAEKLSRRLLREAGLGEDAFAAASFGKQLETMRQIEAMIENVDNRRSDRLRDIDRHRLDFGRRLNAASRGMVTDIDPSAVS